jgi:outer membrane protein
VRMNVAELFIAVLRAGRQVEVVERKAISLAAHCKDVGNFYEKGTVPKNDLLAAEVALADARQQVMQARNALQIAMAAYNRALCRPLTAPVRLAELRDDGQVQNVDELTATALQLRPELAGLSAQACSLRDQADGVRAKRAPQVGLKGGYLYQQNQYIDPNGVALLFLDVQWNAIDSGRTRNQAAALTEKAEALIRLRRDGESMIALDVRQKWLDLQTSRARVEVARQAIAQADENLRVASDRYREQVGTNTEVLDAETLLLQSYTNFYNSSYETVLAGLRLHRAVGDL